MLRTLALAAALMLVPTTLACTGPAQPEQVIQLVVTDADGHRILDMDSGQRYKAGPCGATIVLHPAFDGRFVVWSRHPFRVYDLQTRTERQIPWTTDITSFAHGLYLRALRSEINASVELVLEDLATSQTWTVSPPAQARFHSLQGPIALAAKTIGANTTNPHGEPREGVWLYDAVANNWLVQGLRLDAAAGFPAGQNSLASFNHKWIIVRDEETQFWAYDVANQTVKGPLKLGPPGTTPSTSSYGWAPEVVEVRQDIAYFVSRPSYGWFGESTWSVRLTDNAYVPSGRPPPIAVGGITAFMEVKPPPGSPSPPTGPTEVSPEPDPDSPSPSAHDGTPTVTRTEYVVPGPPLALAFAALLTLAWVGMRRRRAG